MIMRGGGGGEGVRVFLPKSSFLTVLHSANKAIDSDAVSTNSTMSIPRSRPQPNDPIISSDTYPIFVPASKDYALSADSSELQTAPLF